MKFNELEVGKLYVHDKNKFDVYKIDENRKLLVKLYNSSDSCFVESSYIYNDLISLNFEEYIQKVDWSKIEVDTKVYVKDYISDNWKPRYFAKYENGIFCAWKQGTTSWSAENYKTSWKYYKLTEESED